MKTALFCSLLLLSVTVGCGGDGGPPLGPVTGKVTLYGKPYPKGIVTFSPVGGGPAATSSTDDNGDYELWTTGKKGAAIGEHKVSVVTIKEPAAKTEDLSSVGSDDPRYAEYVASGGASAYKAAKEDKEKIPAKYNTSTELKFEVKSGSNKIDLELK